ncbi:hypothetical protein [Blastococcus sp. LR1]|uniref:hypothetical protein n=1 Tax=Blastococcus sp. LR1 TaxID=2877000 RepID=UPI001CCE1D69|nr:hypothetical protein [Blastococcus sp. LR1]MCA0146732.1 hypothetical protein [Blastococcus sp. LR1]
MEKYPGGPGPYGWFLNGEPLLRRDGATPVREQELTRVRLPACEECNSELNRRFEEPAKETLRGLFGTPTPPALTAAETTAVALWFLKTWLLLPHPRVYYANTIIDRIHRDMRWPEPAPPDFYRWTVTGGSPPEGLSLWIYRARSETEDLSWRNGRRLVLPTVRQDGRTMRFASHEVTLHGLTVTLAVHPGWPIDHPLEADGRAVRLWPRLVTDALDLSGFPLVPREDSIAWSRGLRVDLAPGALGSGRLPPLSLDPMPALSLMSSGLVLGAAATSGR